MRAARQAARWTRGATRDLREIWRYYAAVASPEIADGFVITLTRAGERTLDRPLAWRTRDDLAPGLRAIRVKPYILFYRTTSSGIEVLRVLHERRDIAAVFRTPPDLG